MTKLKAEFLQHYYDQKGIPLRNRIIAYFPKLNEMMVLTKGLSNFFMKNKFTSKIIKKKLGFTTKRQTAFTFQKIP